MGGNISNPANNNKKSYGNKIGRISDTTDKKWRETLCIIQKGGVMDFWTGFFIGMSAIMLKDESKVKNKLKIIFNEALILLGVSVAGVVVVYAWVTFLWWVFFDGAMS